MRILITGGTGFIGHHLIPLMNQHQLMLIGRQKVSFEQPNLQHVDADLAAPDTWKEQVNDFSPHACIHLAWSGLPDYSLSKCSENFDINIQLLDFLSGIECKKIFIAGTCWEYGDLQEKLSEGDLPGPTNLFASFKTSIRLIGEQLTKSQGMDLIWGRIFFVYGDGQRPTSLIPGCYQSLKNDLTPEIRAPYSVSDFIHVSDVAKAILALIETPALAGIFNIGSGKPTKAMDVCKIIAHNLNKDNLLSEFGDSTNASGFWADTSLIRQKTGWSPQYTIQTGIEKTVHDFQSKQ
jgi:nucleoside-diphosphate-sugar epimerase